MHNVELDVAVENFKAQWQQIKDKRVSTQQAINASWRAMSKTSAQKKLLADKQKFLRRGFLY